MSESAEKLPDGKPRYVTLASTCRTHSTARGFCNLRMSKVDGQIVLDPHVAGCCAVWLDEEQATAMRDQLTEWLG
jgi:hypothetical protein